MVDAIVRRTAEKAGVKIHGYVNVGNHLHLLVKASTPQYLAEFLRALGGLLPRRLCDCEKGSPLGFSFWDGRPYTKIVAGGLRPFGIIKRYLNQNRAQAQRRVEGFDSIKSTA